METAPCGKWSSESNPSGQDFLQISLASCGKPCLTPLAPFPVSPNFGVFIKLFPRKYIRSWFHTDSLGVSPLFYHPFNWYTKSSSSLPVPFTPCNDIPASRSPPEHKDSLLVAEWELIWYRYLSFLPSLLSSGLKVYKTLLLPKPISFRATLPYTPSGPYPWQTTVPCDTTPTG